MGLVIDNIDMRETFKGLLEEKYFIDKSNIINDFNKLINRNSEKYVCITKPRRFGKTSIAAMLVMYYSKSIDSKEIFDKLKVSKGKSSDIIEKENEIKQYKEYQGKYHTIYLDLSKNVFSFETLDAFISSINNKLKIDIKKLYPNSEVLNEYDDDIVVNFQNLYLETEKKFILVIDEWDYIITNKEFSDKERNNYINFLKYLIKDNSFLAFAYMTGITPIAKKLSQSTLNCFSEYTMLNDDQYYKYFGFTEEEVNKLCSKNKKLTFKDLENWYNGYKSYDGKKIFNTWSVIHALNKNTIKNYWSLTGSFNEVKRMINYDIIGVKEDILEMINGNEIEVQLENYGVEDIRKESENNEPVKEVLYSKMVTFGYLTYYKGKISIPNEELKEEFIKALNDKKSDMQYFYDMIKNSDEMLEVTLHKNVKRMCEILDKSHMEKISPGDRLDHGNLKRVIDYSYFNARAKYDIKEESPDGHGRADVIFLPKEKNKVNEEIIIIELKVNSTAKKAINQIHQKKYYNGLKKKGYNGNVLLIGINYDQKEGKYSCMIEEYDINMKKLSTSESEAERKRRNEPESDGIYKRLRSSVVNPKKINL
ncbi:hypothetical protein H8356DRAFT_1065047 [Neocallimastix lanati (nom. inval.)]|uniref:AAA-ATPase-like domain-containing protein n=1 Tax=Neocallimastix californiae TaxID=1754190 RepID=A0A1Y1ZKJ5_9FUNG|nr:hypothetical protein H8356DRAFT_1065047 [Neocallimastix sp. JGI-2020a]ORY10778.1 hypothetical protein LY90DRAFT_193227 [Neocallimastix californiae]|eukprot:ORY10778.1 hypothetical protein LY90DRAFT_193227 [Neocallimastix californiae]